MTTLSTFMRRVVARWQTGSCRDRERGSEAGDTLVEVLLSLVVLGLAAVALITGFAVAITSSANHRDLTNRDNASRNAINAAIAEVQQNQASAFGTCPYTYNTTFLANQAPLGNSYTISNATVAVLGQHYKTDSRPHALRTGHNNGR